MADMLSRRLRMAGPLILSSGHEFQSSMLYGLL